MAKTKSAAKKKAAQKPEKSFEESLWDTATKLRGSVDDLRPTKQSSRTNADFRC